jgi:RHS repeat-associated protein
MRWYTIVAWHDSVFNTLNLQVNNGTVSSVSYASGAMDTTYPLSIGAHANGTYGINGRLDEVALYKRVLNPSERSWLYNGGFGRTYAELSASTPNTFTYGDPAHKHAVTALSTGESYAYDANGNMITRVEGGLTYNQTFDAENRLISVTVSGQTTQFIYDGDGNMVMTIKPDGSKTIYVGGVYEVDKSSGGSVIHTRVYYPAGGAMRIDGTLYFVLKDHLGSASGMTDASGNALTNGEQRYYPFGEKRTPIGTMLTDRLYTGQRDTGLGIYYYNARFYSPYINHFISADSIVPGYANPQNLNRYSYVTNNPLRYIDPTGHARIENEFGGGCSTSGYCGSTSYSPPPPPVNYCDAHPNACGVPGNNGGSSSKPPPTATPTLGPGGANDNYCPTHPYSCGTGMLTLPSLFTQSGSILGTISALPPSPFACGWFDCALSVTGFLASVATMTEEPHIVGVAFVVDLAATGIAVVRTNEDHSQGEISDVQQLALNGTAGFGLIPGPWGAGFSFVNVMVTLSGFPN